MGISMNTKEIVTMCEKLANKYREERLRAEMRDILNGVKHGY